MITFYIHRAVHGWEHPRIWVVFLLYPRDKKDRKDKIEQARSIRTLFCRSGPAFYYFHSLVTISFPSLKWNTTAHQRGGDDGDIFSFRHVGSKLDLFYGSRHGFLLCIKYRQLHILLVPEDIASPYHDEFKGKCCPVSGRFSRRKRHLPIHVFVCPVPPSGRGNPALRRGSDTE